MEPPPPPGEPSGSRNVEARSPTNVEEAVPQTTQAATPSGAAAEQTATPNVPIQQATSSSSAIVSSGGEQTKRSADPTVEGEIPMSEVKRPRGRPTRAFRQCPVQWSTRKDAQGAVEMVTITVHNANVELPTGQPAHLGGGAI